MDTAILIQRIPFQDSWLPDTLSLGWELNVNLRVNQYVQANVGSHIKYDDDVKIKVDKDGDGTLETGGPKIQFKQLLGVGVVYQF